jgi:uncharacterized tellurite resistance protein B-like protein
MLDPVRLEHFRNLISLVAADGKIKDVEKLTLSKIAIERGIPVERFNIMLLKADEYKYLIPQNTIEREKQLNDMIELALVDGDFDQAEYDLIAMVAGKLGFSQEQFEEIVSAFKEQLS